MKLKRFIRWYVLRVIRHIIGPKKPIEPIEDPEPSPQDAA